MESNESRSLDWKTCFKKILAPHLLNSPNDEEQSNAAHLSIPSNSDEKHACRIIVNPENDGVSITAFLNDPEKVVNIQKNIDSSISMQSINTDDGSKSFIYSSNQCQGSNLACRKQNNSENPHETEESFESRISADAESLAKSFKPLKVKKKEKYIFNKVENSRNPPNWNIAFKKALNSKFASESSLKNLDEFVDKNPNLSHPELLDSWETNHWTCHRLYKDEHSEIAKVPPRPSHENSNKNRHVTKKEEEVLEKLRSARSFKPPQKPDTIFFDGTGVNCFKDNKNKSTSKNRSSDSKKPNNVPPSGGLVCVKPLTIEEIRNRPPNIIFSECWDWDDDDW